MTEDRTTYDERTMDLIARGVFSADERIVSLGKMHRPKLVLWWMTLFASAVGLVWLIRFVLEGLNEGGIQAEMNAKVIILAGTGVLLVFLVGRAFKYIRNYGSSWIALTSHDRVIGKVPARFSISGVHDINIPVKDIDKIEIKESGWGGATGGEFWLADLQHYIGPPVQIRQGGNTLNDHRGRPHQVCGGSRPEEFL